MASAAVRSKAVVMLLFIYCLLLLSLFEEFSVSFFLFYFSILCVMSAFAIILLGKDSWLLYYRCVMNVMSLLAVIVL